MTRTTARSRRRSACALTAALAALALGLGGAPPAAAGPDPAGQVEVPAGVSAGVAVFDRTTGTFTERHNEHQKFRSVSVVKLLIALDYLRTHDPRTLPAADRTRLDAMLRRSDDAAASHYWALGGRTAIVDRSVARLGLTDTDRPPAGYEDYWGYVSLSAADTVRIYRYLLDTAEAPVRDYVMGNLRQSTRCGADGFDQHFGIPGSFERPYAVKQGWSGFGASGDCGPKPAASRTARAAAGVDLTKEALHTTGTVGQDDRAIVAVFTLHPDGTPYGSAYTAVNRLTRSLDVPGAVRPEGTWVGTWGSGVKVRPRPTTVDSAPLTSLPAGAEVLVSCQKQGQEVSVPPYTNTWWAHLPQYGGYMTNIYLRSPGNQLPGVPLCSS
ncbi:hypothetical protein Stsp02_62740 [Streptomyces sp. NBRC 14336]|uniref:hypothetical protein n=1 Tax=Streptomyces sp. NBRC 14336 TaxID=3030992 RepID=UPI0024A55DBF|nr:hypothetical protein [Streptomyces sp. NBRC 14336]GLW50613.1 hypothetical protein Stsp02_62740 [Streptomyces sp. NBRC 14336]